MADTTHKKKQAKTPRLTGKERDSDKFNTKYNASIPPHFLEAIDVVPFEDNSSCCNNVGHLSTQCPESNINSCFRCGLIGHFSKNCDKKLPCSSYINNSKLGSRGTHNRRFTGWASLGGGVGPNSTSMVCVKKREDVNRVEEVEDCFILEFDPTADINDDDDDGDTDDVKGIVCVKKREDVKKVEEVEDCFILDFDPNTEFDNKFSNLSLSEKPQQVDDDDDVLVLAQKGKVACKDYPHSRHICANHPFEETPHELHCTMCYCYICDLPAPCEKWNGSSKCPDFRHCDATDESSIWRLHWDLLKMNAQEFRGR